MGMMRVCTDGKNLMCRSCIERKPVQKQEKAKAAESMQKHEEPAMKEYFCKQCKYNFKRAKHLAVKLCPYCGSKSVIAKGSTARIIADAAKMKGG